MDGIVRILEGGKKAEQMQQIAKESEVWQSMVANVCGGHDTSVCKKGDLINE